MLFRPTPIIEWYYNGRRISRNNFDYIISPVGNELRIRNAGERYAGKYKCDISNNQGKVSSEGSLNVRGKSFLILFCYISSRMFELSHFQVKTRPKFALHMCRGLKNGYQISLLIFREFKRIC